MIDDENVAVFGPYFIVAFSIVTVWAESREQKLHNNKYLQGKPLSYIIHMFDNQFPPETFIIDVVAVIINKIHRKTREHFNIC